MDTATISYLVGVTGASFMSSNAMFSLFNGKLRSIRDKARRDYTTAVVGCERREQKGGENGGKGKKGGKTQNDEKIENVALNVMKEHRNTGNRWYVVWLTSNIAPVVISVILAFVVSAPVIFPVVQAWADKWLVFLLKVGLVGLIVSLLAQTLALCKMFGLRRTMDQRMETAPDTVFQKQKHASR